MFIETQIASRILEGFLASALEKEAFLPSLKVEILEDVLACIQIELDTLKKGVSR
jgi:hypothetical protein